MATSLPHTDLIVMGWHLSASEHRANGVSWPPGKIDEKLKSENMQKSSFSEWGGEGRCRERLYADHIFIQIYFRKHHFIVKSPQAARGH